MEPTSLWAGVTGVCMILSFLTGMRVEVRGVSGVVQDVKNALDSIKSEIEMLKAKFDAPKA